MINYCPNCDHGHIDPPDDFRGDWLLCKVCYKLGCYECFAHSGCCEDCYEEEESDV